MDPKWCVRTICLLLLLACGRVKHETKEALNEGGRMAGTAASEVIEGLTTGVEETWKVDIALSDTLMKQGLALGKVSVEAGTNGNDNILVIYLTNTAAIDDTLRVLAYGNDGLEMGRSTIAVQAAAGSGDYYEARFPNRTDLERKGKVVIE